VSATRPARERGLRTVLSGARGYRAGLAVLVVLLGVMMAGPLESLSVASGRVDTLEGRQAELSSEVERLEQRQAALQRPEEIEKLARGELGMVAPGEIPFVVVTPEPELEVLPDAEEPEEGPWYRRIWRGITGIFD
jgi:cell division protein FtsB